MSWQSVSIREEIEHFVHYYNTQRPHQPPNGQTPEEVLNQTVRYSTPILCGYTSSAQAQYQEPRLFKKVPDSRVLRECFSNQFWSDRKLILVV